MKKIVCFVLSFCFFCGFLFPAFATGDGVGDVYLNEAAEGEILLTVNVNADIAVAAKAYALMDLNTGTLLAARNENDPLYPASVTKIMTLLLVCEAINDGKLSFDEVLSCSQTAAAKGGSQIWLEPGEEMTVRDLLKAAFVYSANDACCLLGEAVAGSEEAFVNLMNARAEALGMSNTHFDNCTGLDDETTTHLTTAYDIALMSRALMKIDYVTDYTTIWMDDLRDGKTQLVNTNRLVRFYSGATGLKTGTTSKAGCCISATAERNGLALVAVVLGSGNSNDRFNGARALLDYGFANYEIYKPQINAEEISDVLVRHGEEERVKLAIPETQDLLLDKGASSALTQVTQIETEADAPVEAGQKLGTVSFFVKGQKISEYDLVAEKSVKKLGLFSAIRRIFTSLF